MGYSLGVRDFDPYHGRLTTCWLLAALCLLSGARCLSRKRLGVQLNFCKEVQTGVASNRPNMIRNLNFVLSLACILRAENRRTRLYKGHTRQALSPGIRSLHVSAMPTAKAGLGGGRTPRTVGRILHRINFDKGYMVPQERVCRRHSGKTPIKHPRKRRVKEPLSASQTQATKPIKPCRSLPDHPPSCGQTLKMRSIRAGVGNAV